MASSTEFYYNYHPRNHLSSFGYNHENYKHLHKRHNNTNSFLSNFSIEPFKFYHMMPSKMPSYKSFYSKYLTEKKFFDSLYSFLEQNMLTPKQLMDYGYPLESFVNGKAFYESKGLEDCPTNLHERICSRCYKQYNLECLNEEDNCQYHPQRAISINIKGESYHIHPCCNAEKGSAGCISNNYHVSSLKCNKNDNFVSTSNNDFTKKNILSLDTEMCYTKNGLEVTKVSLLSVDGKLLYETYVKPDSPIIDYNTQFSGITAEMLENKTTRLEDVQEALLEIINKNTILIGHGLENDLKALHIIHTKIVDTSVLFPDPRGFPFRTSLKYLSRIFLGKVIQRNNHDCKEDAQMCLELILYRWCDFFETNLYE